MTKRIMALCLSRSPIQQFHFVNKLFIYNKLSFTSNAEQQSRNGTTNFQTVQMPNAKTLST